MGKKTLGNRKKHMLKILESSSFSEKTTETPLCQEEKKKGNWKSVSSNPSGSGLSITLQNPSSGISLKVPSCFNFHNHASLAEETADAALSQSQKSGKYVKEKIKLKLNQQASAQTLPTRRSSKRSTGLKTRECSCQAVAISAASKSTKTPSKLLHTLAELLSDMPASLTSHKESKVNAVSKMCKKTPEVTTTVVFPKAAIKSRQVSKQQVSNQSVVISLNKDSQKVKKKDHCRYKFSYIPHIIPTTISRKLSKKLKHQSKHKTIRADTVKNLTMKTHVSSASDLKQKIIEIANKHKKILDNGKKEVVLEELCNHEQNRTKDVCTFFLPCSLSSQLSRGDNCESVGLKRTIPLDQKLVDMDQLNKGILCTEYTKELFAVPSRQDQKTKIQSDSNAKTHVPTSLVNNGFSFESMVSSNIGEKYSMKKKKKVIKHLKAGKGILTCTDPLPYPKIWHLEDIHEEVNAYGRVVAVCHDMKIDLMLSYLNNKSATDLLKKKISYMEYLLMKCKKILFTNTTTST